MKATIFHNSACGTSRKTLAILQEEGVEVQVVNYLETPPSREELARLYKRAGISPREGLRAKEPLADKLGLNEPGTSDDRILDAMIQHPILINRPLVETNKGVKLCRPQEQVRDLL
jgi:arsenate reductase